MSARQLEDRSSRDTGFVRYYCSICGAWTFDEKQYCGSCGAEFTETIKVNIGHSAYEWDGRREDTSVEHSAYCHCRRCG